MLNRVFAAIAALAFSRFPGVHRFTAGSKRGRQITGAKRSRSRSKYMPHQGAKERKRAARCYMQRGHGYYGPLRSATVMMQMSKREYELRLDAELTARAG
jgi:hypothetical protein